MDNLSTNQSVEGDEREQSSSSSSNNVEHDCPATIAGNEREPPLSSSSNNVEHEGKGQGSPAIAKANGKGTKCPPPCPAKGKGKGGKAPPPPHFAKGQGKAWPWPDDRTASTAFQNEDIPEGDPLHVVARLMDGREFDLQLTTTSIGLAVKQQVSKELGISTSRLRLVSGANRLGDTASLVTAGVADGDAINVIILSPLQGSLTRSGLDVPVDVLEMKMELHEALMLSGERLRRVAV